MDSSEQIFEQYRIDKVQAEQMNGNLMAENIRLQA